MKASRLVSLLLTLQQRRGAKAAELAGMFEVSERTIYRDVAALQAAGVPLWTESGRAGGIRLMEGWRTRLDGLTGAEAAALFAGAAPQALAALGLGSVLLAAQAKVLATLPKPLRDRARIIAERFHLDAPGWFHRAEELPHLMTAAETVWGQRRLVIDYRRGDGTVRRVLEPYGLVLKAGVWYLVARVVEDDVVRTYRIARIVEARPGEELFDRPADFALAGWWATSSAQFDRSVLRGRISLRLSAAGLRRLPHVTSPAAAGEALLAARPPDADGWCEVTLAVESEQVALAELIGLGGEVEVLDPPSLRAALAAVGTAMAARNG